MSDDDWWNQTWIDEWGHPDEEQFSDGYGDSGYYWDRYAWYEGAESLEQLEPETKKGKGKNTRKERTFWKEQGEKGQRCKEQKTCPECQDQGWKARGSIEGEERQDKCNAISRVHQQKTQASLWESCWPKFWACEKKESQDSQGRREPAPTTAPTTVETFDQTWGEERHHGNQKILQAVQGWWEHHSKPRHEGPTERKPEGRQSDRMPPKHLLADPSLWGDFKNTLKRHSAF